MAGYCTLTLALYVCLVLSLGGFLASTVKWARGEKDFWAFIPGHGGVLPHFDCQIVTAPFGIFVCRPVILTVIKVSTLQLLVQSYRPLLM